MAIVYNTKMKIVNVEITAGSNTHATMVYTWKEQKLLIYVQLVQNQRRNVLLVTIKGVCPAAAYLVSLVDIKKQVHWIQISIQRQVRKLLNVLFVHLENTVLEHTGQ